MAHRPVVLVTTYVIVIVKIKKLRSTVVGYLMGDFIRETQEVMHERKIYALQGTYIQHYSVKIAEYRTI